MNDVPLKAGALFSGIGGFCLGFAQAGIPTSWAVEIDDYANATYKSFAPETRVIDIDILHAGFPCQSFSQAGDRKGFGDPRGALFFEIPRILKEFGEDRPKVIVLENSPFLRYGEGGAWFLKVQQEIQRAGYWFRDNNCAELNAFEITALPQQRTRLYMVALSTAQFRSGRFDFPNKRHPAPKSLDDYIDFTGEQEVST